MKKVIGFIFVFLICGRIGMSTHNRAGEITYRQISELTFEITITTFTYTLSAADRSELDVEWGDNTVSKAPRVEEVYLPNFYKRNKYIKIHTFPGPGIYEIVVQDPNRNEGVLNIPNSVNVVFSIKTTLLINPDIGYNNTPVLLNPPIDKAALNHVFVHNPSAFDYDGDSLSYSLTICTREDGIPIEDYFYPPASDTLYVDPVSGDLIWDSPIYSGSEDITAEDFKLIYNIAMNIEEWRKGVKIGNIVRDMQIEVYNSDNRPPVNPSMGDFCVEAGGIIEFNITSTDPDGDLAKHTASGGAFLMEESPAEFFEFESDSGYVTSTFRWQTDCSHVREQPYTVVIKVEDNNPELSLVDIDIFHIKVLGPAPENLTAIPTSDYIRLSWSASVCDSLEGYRIYRRIGNYGFLPDTCENGVPPFTGYEMIGETSSANDTTFIDNGGDAGLRQGTEYCYMVVAVFNNGTEGFASEEVCSVLIEGLPTITNVSVQNTDPANGSIYVAWAKPRNLDTIPTEFPITGPYKYLLYRSEGIWGEDFVLVESISSVDLEDTIYIDTGLNTLDHGYIYRVELFNDGADWFRIGSPDEASSIYLTVEPGDNKLTLHTRKNIPWINTAYVIFRQDPGTLVFDSLDITADTVYTDLNLSNDNIYCYKVKSIGTYSRENIIDPLVNFSQENCGTPVDAEPPCPPELSVISLCDSLYNELFWSKPDYPCGNDIVSYNIYYRPTLDGDLSIIGTNTSPDDTTFIHRPENTMAGCYAITAIDSFSNESEFSMPVRCVDSCTYFEIPNVFTPNGDNINDVLKSKYFRFIDQIDMKIYNRAGSLVYETQDPEINWEGIYKGKFVAPGVYYYLCDITETRLTGEETRNITGFIHVITEKGAKLPNE